MCVCVWREGVAILLIKKSNIINAEMAGSFCRVTSFLFTQQVWRTYFRLLHQVICITEGRQVCIDFRSPGKMAESIPQSIATRCPGLNTPLPGRGEGMKTVDSVEVSE